MQIYQNLYEENPCFNRFMPSNFCYQGVNIYLNDLPQFKSQFNLLNYENLKINWKYIKDQNKFLLKATDKQYNIVFKQQSINQQNLQYQGKLINRQDGYSVQAGLKYNYNKNPLRKHTFIPSCQINFSPLEQNSNLDFGVKYNYYNYEDNFKIRTSVFKSIQNKSNFDYSMIGSFSRNEQLQLGLQNNKFWVGLKFYVRKIDFHTLFHYDILAKRYDMVGFFVLNQKTFKIQDKMKFGGGISTRKEILGNINYNTKFCNFGYSLRWHKGHGITMGYRIEI